MLRRILKITMPIALVISIFWGVKQSPRPAKRNPASIKHSQKKKSKNNLSPEKEKSMSSKTRKEEKSLNRRQVTQKRKTKKVYKKMVDYPHYSTPLDSKKASDFIEDRFKKETRTISSPEDPRLSIVSWCSRNYYTKEDEIIVKARLLNAGKVVRGNVRGKLKSGKKLDFKRSSEGSYQATISAENLDFGGHMVKVSATFAGQELKTINQFKLMRQYYTFKGVKGGTLDSQGNLTFDVQFDVEEKGAYLLEGTLYKKDKIIAIAENTVRLGEGEQRVPLKFHGHLFYKRRLDGPFKLKNLQFSYVNENLETHGNAKLIKPQFLSKKYAWDQFNNQPYFNETIGQKLEEMD